MNNGHSFPSCIKIPNTKQGKYIVTAPQNKNQEVEEDNPVQDLQGQVLPYASRKKLMVQISNALIVLANQVFGEKKWSHSVTSQTLDFVDPIMSNYSAGCTTFLKIQLDDGTFHEDVGYGNKEGPSKGRTIHCARLASYNDAFAKVLLCFGGKMEMEVMRIMKDQYNPLYAESNPKSNAEIQKLISSKSEQFVKQDVLGIKEKQVVDILAAIDMLECHSGQSIISNNAGKKSQDTFSLKSEELEHTDKKVMSEELLRIERKRKQMEKQMEYKRLMKEKELQKMNGRR